MEEIKQEEVVVNEVKQEPITNTTNNTNNDFVKISETLEKLLNDNKILKEEIIKLKSTNDEVVKVEKEEYKIDEKLWKEFF